MMKRLHGFTLIEVMVVIALIAIMLTMAVPSFTTMVMNNRLSTQANSLVIAVNLARSEAIKRNRNVVLCRSANGTSCAAGGWEQGWIIYVDADPTDGPGVNTGAGDVILREFSALTGTNTLRASANYTASITYVPSGFSTQAGTLVLCDDRDNDGDTADAEDFARGRAIIINNTGRPQMADADPNSGFTNCVTP